MPFLTFENIFWRKRKRKRKRKREEAEKSLISNETLFLSKSFLFRFLSSTKRRKTKAKIWQIMKMNTREISVKRWLQKGAFDGNIIHILTPRTASGEYAGEKLHSHTVFRPRWPLSTPCRFLARKSRTRPNRKASTADKSRSERWDRQIWFYCFSLTTPLIKNFPFVKFSIYI